MSRTSRRSTCRCTASASSWIPRPTKGAVSPNAIAQPNIASVGRSNGGSPGTASENVPNPVSSSRPRKISEPTPAASRPGTSTTPSIGPPSPAASRSRNAPMIGEPRSELIAAKLPAAAITVAAWSGASRDGQVHGQHAEPAPDQDQRRLRPEHDAEAQRREGGEQHARKLRGRERPRHLEPVRRRVSSGPRQVADRQRDQQAGQREQRQRPPGRRRVEPESLRQVGEQPLLQPRDEFEETVGDRRDGDADEGREHQQLHVATRSEQHERVGSHVPSSVLRPERRHITRIGRFDRRDASCRSGDVRGRRSVDDPADHASSPGGMPHVRPRRIAGHRAARRPRGGVRQPLPARARAGSRAAAARNARGRRDAADRRGARARRHPDAQPGDVRDHLDGARGAARDRGEPAPQLHRPRGVPADGGDRAALHPHARRTCSTRPARPPARARRARRRRSCSARCR